MKIKQQIKAEETVVTDQQDNRDPFDLLTAATVSCKTRMHLFVAHSAHCTAQTNKRINTRLTDIFQDNSVKPVPECHHTGLYCSKDDGDGGIITGCIRRANLQSNHHHQQTNTQPRL